MRLDVDHIGRVCRVAEYSLAVPRFLLVVGLVVHVNALETNLLRVFSVHPFRQCFEEGLLSLAPRTTLTG